MNGREQDKQASDAKDASNSGNAPVIPAKKTLAEMAANTGFCYPGLPYLDRLHWSPRLELFVFYYPKKALDIVSNVNSRLIGGKVRKKGDGHTRTVKKKGVSGVKLITRYTNNHFALLAHEAGAVPAFQAPNDFLKIYPEQFPQEEIEEFKIKRKLGDREDKSLAEAAEKLMAPQKDKPLKFLICGYTGIHAVPEDKETAQSESAPMEENETLITKPKKGKKRRKKVQQSQPLQDETAVELPQPPEPTPELPAVAVAPVPMEEKTMQDQTPMELAASKKTRKRERNRNQLFQPVGNGKQISGQKRKLGEILDDQLETQTAPKKKKPGFPHNLFGKRIISIQYQQPEKKEHFNEKLFMHYLKQNPMYWHHQNGYGMKLATNEIAQTMQAFLTKEAAKARLPIQFFSINNAVFVTMNDIQEGDALEHSKAAYLRLQQFIKSTEPFLAPGFAPRL